MMYRNLNDAIDTLHQVQSVNSLIQGVCARVGTQDLTQQEAGGLWVVLEWQNQKLQNAEKLLGELVTREGAATRAA